MAVACRRKARRFSRDACPRCGISHLGCIDLAVIVSVISRLQHIAGTEVDNGLLHKGSCRHLGGVRAGDCGRRVWGACQRGRGQWGFCIKG